MPSVELTDQLRPFRKDLVLAAEATFQGQSLENLPDKAQFSRLVSVCSEASCAEEIRNYLRYQSSRDRPPWNKKFADAVLDSIDRVLEKPELAGDEMRVEAWKLFATFLSRAFTYERARLANLVAAPSARTNTSQQPVRQGSQQRSHQGSKHHG